MRSVVLTQFRKSVGPFPAVYKYNGNVVVLHRQKRLFSFQNEHVLYFLTIEAFWFEEWSVLDTAIMWMATSPKKVTNRLFIAVFSSVNAFLVEFKTD